MSTKEKWLKQTGAYPESNARDARILAQVKTNSGDVEEKAIMVHPSLRGAAGARTAGGQPPKPFVRIDPNEEIDNDILRQYEFNQLLGRGAYGVVWKVRAKQLGSIRRLKNCIIVGEIKLTHSGRIGKLYTCMHLESTIIRLC